MFESIKAQVFIEKALSRPNIDNAYKKVDIDDPWYNTINKVHESLEEIKKINNTLIEIKSFDNLTLRARYYPSDKLDAPTLIFIHGFTSHAERESAFPGLFYLSLGFNVLIPYQRAHGLSEGNFITLGALESKDMELWINKVNEITPNSKIILHGLSMGGGIALDLINKEYKNVVGIIADAPSLSIEGFINNVCKEVFKDKGDKVAKCAIKRFNKLFNVDINNFNRIENMKSSKYPLLLSAGSLEKYDEVYEYMKSLSKASVDIIILKGCNHGNGMYKQTKVYQTAINKFIKKVLK